MAAKGSDYHSVESLEELNSLIEEGFLEDNEEFNQELESVTAVEDVGGETKSFICEICERKCISSRGLKRHQTLKHKRKGTASATEKPNENASPVIEIDEFKDIVLKSSKICQEDLCLPEEIRNMFQSFDFDRKDTVDLWEIVEPVVTEFHGNAEKFYSAFYGLLQDNLLPQKFDGDITISNILLTEIGNHILSFLSKSKFQPLENRSSMSTSISERELKSLQYIGGYVVHKLYKKYRFCKNKNSEHNKQRATILLSCKVESDSTQSLINIRDRGGLWRINTHVQNIFIECEKIFRESTSQFQTKIDSLDLVRKMQVNSSVISNFDAVCYDIEPKVNKEISLNLLEGMLLLFTKVRAFSFAKDVKEKYKAKNRKSKSRSLRTEIKKASSSSKLSQ